MTYQNDYFKKWDVTKIASTGQLRVVTEVTRHIEFISAKMKRVPKNKILQKIVIAFYKLQNWWYAI